MQFYMRDMGRRKLNVWLYLKPKKPLLQFITPLTLDQNLVQVSLPHQNILLKIKQDMDSIGRKIIEIHLNIKIFGEGLKNI